MFRKGDIVRFEGGDGYAAKFGALAIVVTSPTQDCLTVDVEWLDITSHLSGDQKNGGYFESSFELMSKGPLDKESILEDIEIKLFYLDEGDLRERFMNILGEMEIDRLENILEDINEEVDKVNN